MTVFVEEFAGLAAAGGLKVQGAPMAPAGVISQTTAAGVVSTVALAGNTQFVFLGGSIVGYYILSASSTGSTAAGSTGYIPTSGRLLGVKPLSKLFFWST